MCYRPLRIKNPKIDSEHSDLNATVDKLYITVPCGHCGECRQNKQDDIYLRTNAEFSMIHPSVNISRGFVMFNTLTYDEDNVPMFHGLRCFDGDHITRFIKRVRISLEREYNIPGSYIHFLLVSEYGSDTARPHYHFLAFMQDTGQYDKSRLPGSISPKQLGELITSQWPYGFTQFSNPYDPKYFLNYDEGIVKDQSGCIKYVSKYCVKDFDFLYVLNRQRPAEFIEYLESFLGESVDEIDYQVLFKALPRSEYLRFMPFQRMSHHFGESLVNYDYKSLVRGYILLPDKELGQKAYKVPQYIERKIFYDYDKSTKLYTLNEHGMKMKVERMKYNRCYVSESTENILFHWYTYLDFGRQKSILNYLHDHFNDNIYSIDDVTDYIQTLLDGRSMSDYVNYILLYKDYLKPVHTEVYPFGVQLDAYRINEINYTSSPRYLNKNQCYFELKSPDSMCNSIYEFRYFDELYKLYSYLRNCLGSYKQKDYIFKLRQDSKRKFINISHHGKL